MQVVLCHAAVQLHSFWVQYFDDGGTYCIKAIDAKVAKRQREMAGVAQCMIPLPTGELLPHMVVWGSLPGLGNYAVLHQ